jgi:ribonuclease R
MTKKKKKRGGASNIDHKALINTIKGIFANNPKKTYNYKQIASQLLINDAETKKLLAAILQEMAANELIEEVYRGKYKSKSKTGYITGKLQLTSSLNGFVITEELGEDIFISNNKLNQALNGDTVKVYLFAKRSKRHLEGEIVEILERAKKQFVGVLEQSKNYSFLIADSRNMPYDIFIPNEKLNGARNGQKVIGRITDWPKQAKNPFGEIMEVLGLPGNNEAEMHAILAEYELPYKFPEEVEREAEKISLEIPKEEIKKRRDFRGIPTFTIDPHDAKDFDDALSIQKLNNGNWEIGVHIADVTHYIQPGTILEDEAVNRATSVYLVDRVVPMLPERLSNGVCSLRPHEEKLTFSAVFEMNDEAEVLNEWFGRTVIYSNRRFTYEEAQEIIEGNDGDMKDDILTLNGLARKLRADRFKAGSIDFERDEVKFEIDEEGKTFTCFL